MNAIAIKTSLERQLKAALGDRTILFLFAGTLLTSALLLFSIQPIFAKMVLPTLGGSPSVWAVSMCFFQATLLAGYGYAHILNRYLSHRQAVFAHLGLTVVALFALPFGLPTGAEPPAGGAYLWLIGTLTIGVGLPFFAVSANAPLLQAWFGRTGHPHAADPYFLYGASNLGSLVALLSYPVVIEPWIGLSTQSAVWTGGFVILGLLLATCGTLMILAMQDRSMAEISQPVANENAEPLSSPSWSARFGWMALAFVPSGLLVAFTSYVTTDIASAPFLWVIPLAIFLGTFVLVFRDPPAIQQSSMLFLQPVLVALALLSMAIPGNKGWQMGVPAGFGAFFITTMVCHRELYAHRPAGRHLTEFYMYMSLGGVLGGMFAAIIAPQLFNAIYEFPLLLILGLACRPGIIQALKDQDEREQVTLLALAGGGVLAALAVGIWAGSLPGMLTSKSVLYVILAGAAMMLVAREKPARQLVYGAATGLGLAILPSAMNEGFSERSFFGVHRIIDVEEGTIRILMHGTTIHGSERLINADGSKVTRPKPATYYYAGGPMAQGVDAARQTTGKLGGGLNVGIIGLGAGSMACHSRTNENWRFYEIDPVVVKLATDPARFTFMSKCRPNADIVVGDARLTIAKEPTGRFDYLVIDAFSSDSVPVHLLTTEAIELYMDKLSPDGLLALHISNRHLDLNSVVEALAATIPGVHAVLADDLSEANDDRAGSIVAFFAKSEKALAPIRKLEYVQPMKPTTSAAWTDDYSNVLAALLRHYMQQ